MIFASIYKNYVLFIPINFKLWYSVQVHMRLVIKLSHKRTKKVYVIIKQSNDVFGIHFGMYYVPTF